ncbi:Adenylate cyclase 1 [Pseudovibrio axinellae]|uniref:Adenylate cyclase 1 n=1 Tax=Pseudovibrio axinellae TaxID=989403 RepID=A0A165T5K6_9HYPH|nr:adenylate/guanylate cyclase domain-containing protein [Pseudovibrio axinellae]KZL05465.1 Adenylate cyclase 1 [Pseudovibrio axinellae]SEP98116.1 adenylate cyclase [Pseudovibrio axinellae]
MDRNEDATRARTKPQSKSSKRQGWSAWRLSISTVFSIGAAFSLALIGGTVLLYVSSAANQQTTAIMRETGALIVGWGLEVVEDFFESEERLGLLVAQILSDPLVHEAPETLREQLVTILSRETSIKKIAYTFPSGQMFSAQLDDADEPIKETSVRPPNAQDMREGHMHWSQPYYDSMAGETYMDLSVYISNPVDNTISHLELAYPVTLLGGLMERIKWRQSQSPFILLGKDQVLASTEQKFIDFKPSTAKPIPTLSDLKGTPLNYIWDKKTTREYIETAYNAHIDKTPEGDYLFLYDVLAESSRLPLTIGSYTLASEFSSPFESLHKVYLGAAAFLAVGVLLMFLIGRRLADPIVALAHQAVAIKNLNMEGLKALPSSRLQEIDDANQSFNSASVAISAFSKYVPKDLVRVLLERDFDGLCNTELREMTILFSDIAGFSSVASKLTAEETTTMLNTHFQELADCISQTRGTIDKYIGDGCMAFWGAPEVMKDHAEAAIDAVRLIAEKLEHDLGDDEGPLAKLRVRIGVHTGTVVVGNIGAVERLNYTVVGDVVNVAARLQELGKKIDPKAQVIALATDETVRELKDKSDVKHLGDFKLRGRDEAVDVYRIV